MIERAALKRRAEICAMPCY